MATTSAAAAAAANPLDVLQRALLSAIRTAAAREKAARAAARSTVAVCTDDDRPGAIASESADRSGGRETSKDARIADELAREQPYTAWRDSAAIRSDF